MRSLTPACLLAVVAGTLLVPGPAAAQEKVDVKVVKYSGLADAVKKLKGKVVLVDFWATY
jgi:hypothetical protein